jgi:large subunit ribosomal protein L5
MATRFHEKYTNDVVPALKKEFNYSNNMQVPKIVKIVVNMGIGRDYIANPKSLDAAVGDMTKIVGQKVVVTRAKKSIATFKLRQGMPNGVMVTLRGDRMYEFLDRLLSLALPRIRDFRGISDKSFDGRGNYTLGLKEQILVPEIEYDKVDKVRGMDITVVTTATTDEEARALLRQMGMPFRSAAANA